VWIARPHG
jgi:hypothetical protein